MSPWLRHTALSCPTGRHRVKSPLSVREKKESQQEDEHQLGLPALPQKQEKDEQQKQISAVKVL